MLLYNNNNGLDNTLRNTCGLKYTGRIERIFGFLAKILYDLYELYCVKKFRFAD